MIKKESPDEEKKESPGHKRKTQDKEEKKSGIKRRKKVRAVDKLHGKWYYPFDVITVITSKGHFRGIMTHPVCRMR